MLSLDHHRKRKNIQRQRSRLISPELDAVPYHRSTAQTPFGENGVCTPPYRTTYVTFPSSASFHSAHFSQPVTPLAFDNRRNSHGFVQCNRLTEPLPHPMSAEQMKHYHNAIQQTEKVPVASHGHLPREPVVVFGNGKKRTRNTYCAQERRLVVHGAVSILLLFIVLGTFMAVVPVGGDGYVTEPDSLQFLFNVSSGRKSDIALISAESATATAVTVDGYDPGNMHYAGVSANAVNSSVSGVGALSHFFYGQCTYWANMRYHQLTGHWIPWLGDAYAWAYQAPAYNWILSNTPNPHGYSIMVFSPNAEGSGAYGHVAVVEHVNPDGSVLTSNWNWNGMWATQSWLTFYPGKGVSFIWHP